MKIEEQVALAPRTTLGLGGPARYFVEAEDEAALVQALDFARARGLIVRVLGGGSNLVVSDEGFDGLVLSVALRGLSTSSAPSGNAVTLVAAAGEPWDRVVVRASELGLSGIECLSGIPGCTGATPIQNVGAYGQEVGETIREVRALDRETRQPVTFSGADCRFAYRQSFFKSEAPERFIITSVSFGLARSAPTPPRYAELTRELLLRELEAPSLAELRQTILDLRRKKSMLLDPADENGRSCGSFFLNPVVSATDFGRILQDHPHLSPPRYPQADGRVKLAAGWLIEKSGFAKGLRDGAVGLSSEHALALVAHAGARARDIVELARRVQAGVHTSFGISLDPEPNFWGFSRFEGGLPRLA